MRADKGKRLKAGDVTIDQYQSLFEEMGEDKVLKALAEGQLSTHKEEAAEFWLRRKLEERVGTNEKDRTTSIAEAHLLAHKSLVISQKLRRQSRTNMYIGVIALVLALLAVFLRL